MTEYEMALQIDQRAHERYANDVAAGLFRKFAAGLRRRAAEKPLNALRAGGLLDAAELAEAAAANLESIK